MRIRCIWELVLHSPQWSVRTLGQAIDAVVDASVSSTTPAKVLKRFIKQPRPVGTHKKTYGMPSTHSSSIAFFGVYLSLCAARLKPHPRFLPTLLSRQSDSENFSLPVRLLLTGSVLYGASSVCWSRVKLTYHTPAQVIAGAAVGSTLAVACFALWQHTLADYAPIAERIVEDLLLVGLESWQGRTLEPIKDNLIALQREWQHGQL